MSEECATSLFILMVKDLSALKMEAAGVSKTLGNFHVATRCRIPEDWPEDLVV
jgi:hypothetical protein